jgi:cytoskeletal protein CcmA (bactofilin family)
MIGNKKEKTTTPSGGSAINVIGDGTKIVGDLSSNGDLRIDGVVEGSVRTQSKCVLGATGRIIGNIESKNCDISGRVDGNVKVNELLLIKASGKINGDIKTAKIIVENGGEFNGACTMGSSVSITSENVKPDVQAATA